MGRREHANSPASMPPADVEELPSKQTSSPSAEAAAQTDDLPSGHSLPSAEAAAQTDDLPSGHSLPSGHNALPSGHSLPSGHNALPSGHNAVDAGPLLIDLLDVKEEVEECMVGVVSVCICGVCIHVCMFAFMHVCVSMCVCVCLCMYVSACGQVFIIVFILPF